MTMKVGDRGCMYLGRDLVSPGLMFNIGGFIVDTLPFLFDLFLLQCDVQIGLRYGDVEEHSEVELDMGAFLLLMTKMSTREIVSMMKMTETRDRVMTLDLD